MSEKFVTKVEAGWEIEMPGDPISSEEELFDELTPQEETKFDAASQAIIEASRPQPGDSDIRLGA